MFVGDSSLKYDDIQNIEILFLDYFENIGIVTLIIQLPQKLPNLVMLTSLFTSLKWILIAITIVLIFTLVIVKFYNQRAKN